jgi:voltage-gated potassium channel
LLRNIKPIKRRLSYLLKQPFFWSITLLGQILIFSSAALFYYLEYGINDEIHSFLDCLSWSVGIMATIGYGLVIPVTTVGKILSIGMMLIGSLFLWSYMAIFVSALLAPDLSHIENEIDDLEKNVSRLSDKMSQEKSIKSQSTK